ncbi:hypothetical protein [Novosphingobium sp. PhB55]|uniref:hypothetical protein n=1 Tax=Novosphingobium sp. PhB55 TaxID=2485106 RepID=UPI00106638F4|nr:hypothetical protein [Novosphingobium sp. PhB55]
MSLIATAVKHLIAAGVTGDALLAAIAELETQVRAEPKPRSAGAARTQRWRENKRLNASQTSHVTAGDGCDEGDGEPSLPRLPNENNSNPSTPTHPEEKSRASDAGTHEAAGTDPVLPAPGADPEPAAGEQPAKPKRTVSKPLPMPDAWEPVLTAAAQQIVDGWPPGMLERERMAFEAHAASNDRVTKDWQAAFRTWIAKADRNRTERNGIRSTTAGRGFAGNHQPDRRDGFTRSLDETIARGRAGGAPLQ